MRSRRPSEAGFTLVEMLVAVAILAAIAAIAVPLTRGPPLAAQIKADTSRIAAALRLTRAAALSGNRPLDIRFDPENQLFASPAVPVTRIDPRLTAVLDTGQGGRSQAIRFFPSGRSSGGRIELRAPQTTTRISVIWATGAIVVDP